MTTNTEQFEKFTDLISNKQSATIEISGACDTSGMIHYRPEREIKFKENCTYYVSLLYFRGSSLFPNITNRNNKFYYINNNNEEKVITFKEGSYNVKDIDTDIKEHCGDNVILELSEATGRCTIKLSNNYKVDFTKENTINNLLKFDSVLLTRTTTAPDITEILTIEDIYIYCSIIKGCYDPDGKQSTILYSFGNSKRYGSVIEFRPNPLQEYVLTQKKISEIFISFKDDKKHPITFQGSNVHLILQIKQA